MSNDLTDAQVQAVRESYALRYPAWRESILRGEWDRHPDLTFAFLGARAVLALAPAVEPFQARIGEWMLKCFTPEIAADRVERGDRLLEEVLELLQSGGYDFRRIPALTKYVDERPVGEPAQEVGGVMVTLAAYCAAFDLDMQAAGETELARINVPEIVLKIRAKQKAKPTGSALPIAQDAPAVEPAEVGEALEHAAYLEAKANRIEKVLERAVPGYIHGTDDNLRIRALSRALQQVTAELAAALKCEEEMARYLRLIQSVVRGGNALKTTAEMLDHLAQTINPVADDELQKGHIRERAAMLRNAEALIDRALASQERASKVEQG